MESLTGPQAVAKAISDTIAGRAQPPKTTVVHFKVSSQGITLTDNKRKWVPLTGDHHTGLDIEWQSVFPTGFWYIYVSYKTMVFTNEFIAIISGGWLDMLDLSLWSNCLMAENIPEKLSWCMNKQVCQGVELSWYVNKQVCQGVKLSWCVNKQVYQGVKCRALWRGVLRTAYFDT